VPLILKLPASKGAGKRVEAPVGLADVAPTLLELAGIEPPAVMTGQSLLAHLRGTAVLRPVYSETFYPRLHFGWSELTSLVDGAHHYIEGPDPELYNLEDDPAERTDLLVQEKVRSAFLRKALASYGGDLEEPSPVGEEERRALAALGYVGRLGGTEKDSLSDPKTRLGTVADLKACLRSYGAGVFEAAAAACGRAVKSNPDSLDAWEYLGRSEQARGRQRQAFQAFVRALDLADGRAGHLAVTVALLLIEARRAEGALNLLEYEIPKTVDSRPLRLLAARTLVLLGRLDEAQARADALVVEFPSDADAVYLRGAVKMGLRQPQAGEADLRRALAIAPQHTAALSDLAMLLEHRGEFEEARKLVRRVLELRPGDPMMLKILRRLEGEK
jgi:tetratricopeptide (TPR) repeat protein